MKSDHYDEPAKQVIIKGYKGTWKYNIQLLHKGLKHLIGASV